MDYLVFGIFAVACALIYCLLTRQRTKKTIRQIKVNTNRVIEEMNQETRQFMEEISEIQRKL